MSATIRIAALVENHAAAEGMEAEHGMSWWIETPRARVLVDCGASDAFARNARRMGIDLARAQAIVLSHGHYDHTGGLETALAAAPQAKVFAHPLVRQERYSIHDDRGPRAIGIDSGGLHALVRGAGRLIETPDAREAAEEIWVTGEVPRETPFEDTGGPFYRDAAGRIPDLLPDDLSVYIHGAQGLIVLLGCAHAGIVNILRHIQRITVGAPIHAILGGMHLVRADRLRIDRTIEALRAADPTTLGPCHCTGAEAIEALRAAFPERYVEIGAGTILEFKAR